MANLDTVIFDREKLAQARLGKFWTRQQLARAAGVSYAVVWCAQAGKRVSLQKAQRIAKALRIALSQLASPALDSSAADAGPPAGSAPVAMAG